jgi:hypothetical protein
VAHVDARAAGVRRAHRGAEHAVGLGDPHERVGAAVAVGQRLGVADADLAIREVALVVHAGDALRERLGIRRRAREQVFAVRIRPVRDVEQRRGVLPDVGREHAPFGIAERGVRALQRALAHLLQDVGDVGHRLFFVIEAGLDDVRVALELSIVGQRAVEHRGARGADRVFRRGLEFLARGELLLRARHLDLMVEDGADAGVVHPGGGHSHGLSPWRPIDEPR